MTRLQIRRKLIIDHINATTAFDPATVKFHRDGTISAIQDANKTFNGPHKERLTLGSICHLEAEALEYINRRTSDFKDSRS